MMRSCTGPIITTIPTSSTTTRRLVTMAKIGSIKILPPVSIIDLFNTTMVMLERIIVYSEVTDKS